MILAVFAIVIVLIAIASILCKTARAALTFIKNKVFMDYSLQFFYMVYIKICITVMNQIDLKVRDSYHFVENDYNWGMFMGVIIFGAPILMFAFLYRNGPVLNEESVKAKYENLYSDAALYRNPLAKFYQVAF